MSAIYHVDISRVNIWIFKSILFQKSLWLFSFLYAPSTSLTYLKEISLIFPLWKCPGGCFTLLIIEHLPYFQINICILLCLFLLLNQQMTLTKTYISLGWIPAFGELHPYSVKCLQGHMFISSPFVYALLNFLLKPIYSDAMENSYTVELHLSFQQYKWDQNQGLEE